VTAVEDTAGEGVQTGAPVTVRAHMFTGSLGPADLRVEIVHGAANPDGELADAEESRMHLEQQTEDGTCVFSGTFAPIHGGSVGYAIRILPSHPDLRSPFETGLARWG
ncbi:MAG: hypothetical protein ABIP13_09095, partial [Tepidiformaceae bacterium]